MHRLVVLSVILTVVACLPGCGKLLGIDEPKPEDRIDGSVVDGPPLDSSAPCVPAATFLPEQTFSIGAPGAALAVAQLDSAAGRDVAIAVGDGVQIMSGNGAGAFSLGMKITGPADGLALGDFDNDGDRDIVAWDGAGTTIAAYRRDATTFGAAQPLSGPFTGLQGAMVGYIDAVFIDDLLVKDASGAWAYTSRQLSPIDFARGASAIQGVSAGDELVAFGDVGGGAGYDAVFVSTTGDVKIAFDAPSFTAAAGVASGARQRCVGFGQLDADAEIDMIVGTSAGGVIYRGGGGTFAQVPEIAAAVTGPSMQVIDVNGDGKDDLVLATRLVYQCAPATPGGPGVFTQFDSIDASGSSLMVDVTGDGKPDLLRIAGTALKVRVQQ